MPIKFHTKNLNYKPKDFNYNYDIYRALKPEFMKNEEIATEVFGRLDLNIIEHLEGKKDPYNLL